VNKTEHYKKLYNFINDVAYEKSITNHLINRYKIKKIKGTNDIYKFYLNNEGLRLLFKYEQFDNQIFKKDSAIVLLDTSKHDQQGTLGKLHDKKNINLKDFITTDFPDEIEFNITSNEIDEYLGHNFMKTYHFDTFNFEKFLTDITEEETKAIYKLSLKQLKALNTEGPLFLLGCAGSGKTLVEISKSLANANDTLTQAYFTYTPMLKEVASTIYTKYENCHGISGLTYFYTLEEYFLNQLGLNKAQYFQFERFKHWFNKEGFIYKYKWTKKIDVFDLWSEIRGLVKGYIGNDFFRFRTLTLTKELVNEKGFEKLIELNAMCLENTGTYTYFINNTEALYKDLKFYPKLEAYIKEIEFKDYKFLDERSYVKTMNEKYTQYDQETRQEIFNFVKQNYQPYLDENELYDDNDLARLLINRIDRNENRKFDYVFVDELQDLSELQVFALTKLAKDPHNILMSGDVAQTINPTFFKRGRIGLIFKNRFNIKYAKAELTENFRNSKQIIDLVSQLVDIRIEKLGNDSDDIRETSTSLEHEDGLPFFLKADQETIENIISTWLHIPRVAIIVASEETKKYLQKTYKLDFSYKETNIYTVQEIKGQEFDKIITFNIISEFKDEWETIMDGKIDKKGDLVYKYRYYFNLLYVAITRGRKNLFFFEKHKNLDIVERILEYFDVVDKNLEQILDLAGYDTDENKLKQAREHFNNGDYDRAKTFYLQLNDRKNAQICAAYNQIKKGEFKRGVIGLYIHKEQLEKAYELATTKDTLHLKLLIGFRTGILSIEDIDRMLGKHMIKDLLKEYKELPYYNRIFNDSLKMINILGKYRSIKMISKIKEMNNNDNR